MEILSPTTFGELYTALVLLAVLLFVLLGGVLILVVNEVLLLGKVDDPDVILAVFGATL